MIPQKKYNHLNIHIDSHKEMSVNQFITNVKSDWLVSQSVLTFKPEGLYFSCGPSFFNNCISGESGVGCWLTDDNPVYNLILDDSKLIHIQTVDQLDNLYENFRGKGPHKKYIDWKQLSAVYSGIKLCPYLKPKIIKIKDYITKTHYLFICSLDGASGCIWNGDCIVDIKYGGNLGKFKTMNYVAKKLDSILLKLTNMN